LVRELKPDFETKINQYERVTQNTPLSTLVRVLPYLELRFLQYDKFKHLAIQTMLMHSDLTINQEALVKGSNDYSTDQSENVGHFLYNADVKVYLKNNSFNAKLC
jgi:hypothetical protein